MGNCLGASSNKVLAEETVEPNVESPQTILSPKEIGGVREAKKKNRVRFRLHDDNEENRNRGRVGTINPGESKTGVVRIRLVVTQEELKQILEYKRSDSKFSSVEQLLREIRSRGRSVSGVERSDENYGVSESWSPALESIPEDS